MLDLFVQREAEFGFSDRFDRPAVDTSAFLSDPEAALAASTTATQPVVILTTWADWLGPALAARSFSHEPIDWPAGPDNSAVFRRAGIGRAAYFELVNDDDPKIAAAHVVEARDDRGFLGGTVSALSGDAAWLAVMCVRADSPRGAGTELWNAMIQDLKAHGITRLDLGTQTAEHFYMHRGMRVTCRVMRRLRWRPGPNGPIWHDLVMMSLDLSRQRGNSACTLSRKR